jgi:hypothetical protein
MDAVNKEVKLYNLNIATNKLEHDINDLAYITGIKYNSIKSDSWNQGDDYYIGDTVIDTNSIEYICQFDDENSQDSPSVNVNWEVYDNRVYLKNIGDKVAYDSLANGFLIPSSYNIADDTDCKPWSGSESSGDIVIYQGQLWQATTGISGTYPTVNGTDFDLISTVYIGDKSNGVIVDSNFGEWKPMKADTDDKSSASNQFIEFSFEPEIEPETSFENFSIKVEMNSVDKVNMPVIRNLRAIAVI